MTPLRNNKSFSDLISSFKLGLINGAANKIFQENLWLKFSFKCFAGSECSCHHNSTLRPVSPMYVCSQTHTPWCMTHAGCEFLNFSLKSCFTFFVIHLF